MKPRSSGELNGFLDRGSSFRGDLEFEDTMRIDGRLKGSIRSKNELIVGETAVVEADIHVGRISISGAVIGTVRADQRVEVHPGGRVYGEIITPALIAEEGAILQGRCAVAVEGAKGMAEKEAAGSAPDPRASQLIPKG